MNGLDTYIFPILESYTGNLSKDNSESPTFIPSGIWDEILTKLSLFKFPIIEPDTSMLALMSSAAPIDAGVPQNATNPYLGAYIAINEEFKNHRIENIYKLEYVALYPAIIYKFVKSGRVAQTTPLRIFCYLWINRGKLKKQLSREGYLVLKVWLNWFFGKVPGSFPEVNTHEIVSEAKLTLMHAVSAADQWYYVDTDEIYFQAEDVKAFEKKAKLPDIEFEITSIKKAVFFAIKKYVIGDENTVIKGFKLPKKK